MTTLGSVLLIWAVVLAVLVGALVLATRHRRVGGIRQARIDEVAGLNEVERRLTLPDRRLEPDRRRGLPDTRATRVERRRAAERRIGVRDRRGTAGLA